MSESPQPISKKELSTDVAPTEENREHVPPLQVMIILVPLTMFYFLVMLDNSIITTAIPSITTKFNSLLDVGWYGSAYQLASSAFQPVSGKIYTHLSTKWAFFVFVILFELGSALCGAATSSNMFIIGRAVAGIGSAGVLNGALTIIACILPPHKQAMVMGVNVGLGQIGVAVGPLIGGVFTEKVSWRWLTATSLGFYINLPIGAAVMVLYVFTQVPEVTVKPPVREVLLNWFHLFDMVGFVLIAPAAIMFLLAMQYGGNTFPWDSSEVIGLFVGAAVTLVVFLFWEHRMGEDAMVPFYMLKKQVVWSASFTLFFMSGVLYVGNYYLPIYFQSVKNDSATMSGVHTLPSAVGQALLALMAGILIHALGYYLPWVIIGTIIASVGYGVLSLLEPDTPVAKWVGYQIPFGIGVGAAFAPSFIAIQNSISAAEIPVAMAIVIFTQYLGGATFLTGAQTIFANVLKNEIKDKVPGVDPNLVVAAGATAVRKVVTPEQLPGVLEAYATALSRVMYLGAGISVAALPFGCFLGWKDIRVKNPAENSAENPCESGGDQTLEGSQSERAPEEKERAD
ncbi:Fc.00g046480.m01.CDS01 [Cosmosporella sp. VM-42]